MTYVREVECDVFISYAHIDNQPFGDSHSGWITDFHNHVQSRLQQLLGNAAEVWRDPKLHGNEVVWELIEARLRHCALFVLVLTPRYIESESCLRELECFERALKSNGGLQTGARRRVFKVEKTPVPRARHPEAVKMLTGYEFYGPDPESGEPREYHLHPNPDVRFRYWPRLDDVAHDMATLLREMQGHREEKPTPSETASRLGVYLAATTEDVRDERERLERELKDGGCEILPDGPLPESADEIRASVRTDLAKCQLSVHLLGGNYGVVPSGENRSVVVLQHEIAAERLVQNGFAEIVWMRPHVQAQEPAQREFISRLELHAEAHDGFEFIKTDMEGLKTVVLDRLRGFRSPTPVPVPKTSRSADLYLICDRQDRDAAEALHSCLFEQGFEVTLPLESGKAAELREFHEGNLRVCDVALIFYGLADQTWFQMKLLDLRRAAAFGRSKPLVAWVYLAAPQTAAKKGFGSRQIEILDGTGKLPREDIARLAAKFSPARGSTV